MLPVVSVEAMDKHLAAISTCVSPGAVALLVMDGAGWHRSPSLKVPGNIVLLTLPPYAPELNPIENLWATLRANSFAHQVWETYEEVVDATCAAWNTLVKAPHILQSIGHRSWAEVKT